MRPTLVEFAGIPGTGKTTIARALAAHVRSVSGKSDVRLVMADDGSRAARALWKIAAAARHPGRAIGHWRVAARLHRNVLTAARIAVNAQRAESECRPGTSFVILDQAVAQIGWSLMFEADKAPNSGQVSTYLSTIYDRTGVADKVVVLVECPTALIRARLEQRRGRDRLKTDCAASVDAAAAAYAGLCGVVEQLAHGRGDLVLVRVTGDGVPEENARSIWRQINRGATQ